MNSNVAKLPVAMQQLFSNLDKDILESFVVPSYALKPPYQGKAPFRGSLGNGQAITKSGNHKILGTPLSQIENTRKDLEKKATAAEGCYTTFLKEIRIEDYTDDVEVMSKAVNPLAIIDDKDDIDLVDYQNCEYREAEKSTNELAFMNMIVASHAGKIGNLEKDGPNLKEFRKGFDSLV